MVEVFKTNVRRRSDSIRLLRKLTEAFPLWKINFDLWDSDKILRVEGEEILPSGIITMMRSQGFEIEMLD